MRRDAAGCPRMPGVSAADINREERERDDERAQNAGRKPATKWASSAVGRFIMRLQCRRLRRWRSGGPGRAPPHREA